MPYKDPAKRRTRYSLINARRRQRYAKEMDRVSAEKLRAIRKNPDWELEHGWKKIVCRECGAIVQILDDRRHSHLSLHGLTKDAYLAKWPGARLVSVAFKTQRAKHGRKPKHALRGETRPTLRIRGHKNARPITKAQLKPLVALGFSCSEIGKLLNRHFTTVAQAIQRFGLPTLSREQRAEMAEGRALLQFKQRSTNKGGRPRGMEEHTMAEARELERHISAFLNEHGTKRGAIIYAAGKVYPNIESRKAVERAKKTLSKYRQIRGTKPLA